MKSEENCSPRWVRRYYSHGCVVDELGDDVAKLHDIVMEDDVNGSGECFGVVAKVRFILGEVCTDMLDGFICVYVGVHYTCSITAKKFSILGEVKLLEFC